MVSFKLPRIDGAGGARREAVAAVVADVEAHRVVAPIVGDRVARARGLAGVAADADLGVDEVLTREGQGGGVFHRVAQWKRTYSKSADWLLIPRGGGAIQWAY